MSTQANLLLEKNTVTFSEFNRVYNKLMRRTWDVNQKSYNLFDLGWVWGYNNAKKSLGQCTFSPSIFGKKHINISRKLLELNLEDNAKYFEDTIRHEIAHAIDYEIRKTSDHGYRWQNIAVQVGARPTRGKIINSARHKWTGTCPNCKDQVNRHALRGNAKYAACSDCCNTYRGGRYTALFQLEWTKNY